MSKASGFVTASFAVLMAGTSLSVAAETSDVPILPELGDSFGTNAAPLQLADIGGWFDDLSSRYNNNQAIQDIDQKFQELLGSILDHGGEPFHNDIYSPYSDDMASIAGGYYMPDAPEGVDIQVDICTSTSMHSFFNRYLSNIETYLRDNPDVAAQLRKIPEKNCRIAERHC